MEKGGGPEQRTVVRRAGGIITGRSALEKHLTPGLVGLGGALDHGGVEAVERPQVGGRCQIDGGIDGFDLLNGERVHPIEPLFIGKLIEGLREAFRAAVDHGQATG